MIRETYKLFVVVVVVVVVECICSTPIVPDNHVDACAWRQNKCCVGKFILKQFCWDQACFGFHYIDSKRKCIHYLWGSDNFNCSLCSAAASTRLFNALLLD